jgi:pimeloyl-ACP methyl ester carboxylesterase
VRRRRSTYLITSFFLASWTAPQAAGYSAAFAASIDDTVLAKQVDVGGGRMLYLYCSGPARPGLPTVILISGYHDSSDPWTQPDVLSPLPQATGPSVLPGLARTDRVCAYDRPGTVRYIDGPTWPASHAACRLFHADGATSACPWGSSPPTARS